MSIPEDAASVLEQFVHDVANTPAEITHLLEEVQNKDLQIGAFKEEISKRDAQLQKWVRVNGGHVPHGKEEAFAKTINDCYDQCEVLQAEKVGLSEKALVVLERQIKRLDVGLRRLSAREEFPADWNGPSLLSGSVTGVSTPVGGGGGVPPQLQPVSGNIGVTAGAPNIANAAQIRMAQTAAAGRGGQQTPAATLARSQREGSTDANKRRRLNPTVGNLPAGSSNLRQSSLGPGTPKAGTPVPGIAGAAAAAASSRAGSAQPSRPTANQKKAGLTSAPGQPPHNKRLAPHHAGANPSRKRSRLTTHKKGDRRRQLTRSDRDRATPSSNASEASDAESDSGASPTPSSLPRSQADGTAESTTLPTNTPANPAPGATASTGPHKRSHHGHSSAGGGRRQLQHQPSEEEEEGAGGGGGDEDDDDELYCYCQKVSYGDMVGCDNADCRFQWFHWHCVGIKSEPEGEWMCPTCSAAARGEVWKGNGLGR
ncbi:hypothetical protein B0A54_10282 [Friedmanniomyces endolithicus]|uniref:Chromatin modification-related protein n=1 Tax=Friedmanniomyces endolithicus TaxID=329885 RepID=A0A4U0UV06_9PEZI|nr:hypothetical protein B0A54_10282 [Friedmanniomyces endolithicus]